MDGWMDSSLNNITISEAGGWSHVTWINLHITPKLLETGSLFHSTLDQGKQRSFFNLQPKWSNGFCFEVDLDDLGDDKKAHSHSLIIL